MNTATQTNRNTAAQTRTQLRSAQSKQLNGHAWNGSKRRRPKCHKYNSQPTFLAFVGYFEVGPGIRRARLYIPKGAAGDLDATRPPSGAAPIRLSHDIRPTADLGVSGLNAPSDPHSTIEGCPHHYHLVD